MASLTLPEGSQVQYDAFHAMLGHPGVSSVQHTAKYLGLGLSNPTDRCPNCATAKMRQKNFPKENVNRSTFPGERLCIDTSSVKSKSYGGNEYWSLAVDEATGMSFASFIAKKSQVKEHIVPLVRELRNKGKSVKYIRCDNAGENMKLKEECDRLNLGIEFKWNCRKKIRHPLWKRKGFAEQSWIQPCNEKRTMGQSSTHSYPVRFNHS